MYTRPDDHITYLQDCLKTLESEKADEPVAWNQFIAASKPLPPIPSEHKNHSSVRKTSSSTSVPCGSSQASGTYLISLQINLLLGISIATIVNVDKNTIVKHQLMHYSSICMFCGSVYSLDKNENENFCYRKHFIFFNEN